MLFEAWWGSGLHQVALDWLKPELRNGFAAKGRKERKAKADSGNSVGEVLFESYSTFVPFLCVLCAISRLNFGVRAKQEGFRNGC